MTTVERDAARLLEACLQTMIGVTFISTNAQIFIGDRLKTAQAFLNVSTTDAGRRALVHVTSARDHVEAIEVPRLRLCIQAALDALHGRRGLSGEVAVVPEVVVPVVAPPAPPPPSTRGLGLIALVLAIAVAALLYQRRKA